MASAVEAASAVKASGMESSAMEAANARLSSEAIGPRISSVPESTEGAGMCSLRHVRSVGCMKRLMAGRASAVRIGAMKTISIDDGRTMRDVRVVVVDDPPAVVPIVPPSVPTPAEMAKWCDPKRESKTDSWSSPEKPRVRIPTREHRQRSPIYNPGIILRDVNHVGRCGLNDNRLSLSAHCLLRGRLQVPRLLSSLAHHLNRLAHLLLLVHVRIPKF